MGRKWRLVGSNCVRLPVALRNELVTQPAHLRTAERANTCLVRFVSRA